MENLQLNLGETPPHHSIILSQSYSQKLGQQGQHKVYQHQSHRPHSFPQPRDHQVEMQLHMERSSGGSLAYANAHTLDTGDSVAMASGLRGYKSHPLLATPQLATSHSAPFTRTYSVSDTYQWKPSAQLLQRAANSTLNASATEYNMQSTRTTSTSTSLPPGLFTHHQSHLGLLPKPTYSAPSQFGVPLLPTPPESGDFQLNVGAAAFTPSRGLQGLPLPSQSAPLLQTPSQRHMVKPSSTRWRRQPLPDLFHAVLALMHELNRSVSYPEIINSLATRLQRPEVELKRHVPHTLHAAVNNGYLRKDGNRYTLLSEQEQAEIMRRNQEAAQRAKELEKEPLCWRKR